MLKEVAVSFVEAINSHDVDRLCGLMTENHTFIDADDNPQCCYRIELFPHGDPAEPVSDNARGDEEAQYRADHNK